MKLIPLTRGQFSKVDDEDFEKFGGFKWYASYDKPTNKFYAHRDTWSPESGRKHLSLHREIMGNPPGKLVDHWNHDTLDNQKKNLRECNKSQNGTNRTKARCDSKSGVRGVSWHKGNGQWRTRILVAGKEVVKYFNDIESATQSFAQQARERYGEFAGQLQA